MAPILFRTAAWRAVTLALVLSSAALAGCIGASETEAPPETSAPDGVEVMDDLPEPTFNDLQVGVGAPPDANATLERPPELQVGEYWRIRITSPLTGDSATFLRVVAAVEEDLYVMGMPHEGWYKEAMIYHVPFFGDVNKDLSGRAHDIPFVPLQFPLTDGATWETNFQSDVVVTATVTQTGPQTVDVAFTDPNGNAVAQLTYDAAQHEITSFSHATIIYQVLEHGYDFEGWVTVPRGERLVFFHGRVAGATWLESGSPLPLGLGVAPSPVESVEIAGGFNRMSFILAAGGFTDPGVGHFSEKAVAPDGTEFQLEATNEGQKIEFFEFTDPDGIWQLEHVAAGAGLAFIEGIAYHQYDIKVPTGEKRADHSHPVIR